MADENLLRLFLEGNPSAYRTVEKWAQTIVRFKGYFVPADQREDVVAEAVKDIWQAASKPGFTLRESFRAFVNRIAFCRVSDWGRQMQQSVELKENTEDAGATPLQGLIETDRGARVRWMLRQLDARCRKIFELFYFRKLRHKEIAERLGIAEATSRVHLKNCTDSARKKLPPYLADLI